MAAMTAIKLDGEMLAAEVHADLRNRIEALKAKGVTPGLGTILVGDDGPSHNYVAMKHRDSFTGWSRCPFSPFRVLSIYRSPFIH